jgi:hypothetical protein
MVLGEQINFNGLKVRDESRGNAGLLTRIGYDPLEGNLGSVFGFSKERILDILGLGIIKTY